MSCSEPVDLVNIAGRIRERRGKETTYREAVNMYACFRCSFWSYLRYPKIGSNARASFVKAHPTCADVQASQHLGR